MPVSTTQLHITEVVTCPLREFALTFSPSVWYWHSDLHCSCAMGQTFQIHYQPHLHGHNNTASILAKPCMAVTPKTGLHHRWRVRRVKLASIKVRLARNTRAAKAGDQKRGVKMALGSSRRTRKAVCHPTSSYDNNIDTKTPRNTIDYVPDQLITSTRPETAVESDATGSIWVLDRICSPRSLPRP